MRTVADAAADFLSGSRIAVTGVSRNPQGHGSNAVYTRLRDRGYEVYAVNPNADEVEGDPCYRDIASLPTDVDGVVIGTRPDHAMDTMRQCVDAGITRVWMHRAFGGGSVSAEATEFGRDAGVEVIDGGCPLMFGPASDFGHRCMKPVLTWTGAVPKRV